MKLRICIHFNNGYPEKSYRGCIHGKERICSLDCPQYMVKSKDPTRYTCNWLVKTTCTRGLKCEGHCPEYTRHKSNMTRGVSPLEAAFQEAIKEGQDIIEGRKVLEPIRIPEKLAESDKGSYKCPVCGNEKKTMLTRLRPGWWLCRECEWEGLVNEKTERMSKEDFE